MKMLPPSSSSSSSPSTSSSPSSSVSIDNQNDGEEPKFPLISKCYKILQQIGREKNCTIFRAFCIPMNSYVVIKSTNLIKQSGKNLEPAKQQSTTAAADDRKIWSVMSSFSAGSLQSLLFYSFPTGLQEDCIAAILNQILNQLYYLHFNNILHRDINAGNILLDHKGQVKLADFTYSSSISELGSLYSYGWSSSSKKNQDISGSLYWVAPEVAKSSDGYSLKADIWSFGILALELAHGRPPLFEIDKLSQSMIKKIDERFFLGNYENFKKSSCSESDKRFSESFIDLVKGCLQLDPGNRPTLMMVQKHAFFKDCESADFLAKNILKDSLKLPTMAGEDENEKVRISGWELNDKRLELCPILYNVPIDLNGTRHVKFGGETIIEEKEVTMEVEQQPVPAAEEMEVKGMWDEDMFNMFSAVSEQMDIISEKMDYVNETTPRNVVLATLYFVKASLETQLSRVNGLIITHGGELEEKKFNVLVPPETPAAAAEEEKAMEMEYE